MSPSYLLDVAISQGWLAAAHVDLVRGAIVDRRTAAGAAALATDDVLFAAIEMLRSGQRPRQLLLFTDEHVHFYERPVETPHIARITIAERTENIGLLIAALRGATREARA